MRAHFVLVALISGAIVLAPMSTDSQGKDNAKSEYQLAVDELESTLSASENIRDIRKLVIVRSKAASLLWGRDSERARNIFIKLWESIDKRTDDESLDKEAARVDLLEYLFPRDRSLAIKLADSTRKDNEKNVSLVDKLNGTTPETRRLALLSYRLAEGDAVMASRVLELSLAENTAPMVPFILGRIRQDNPLLANYVVSQALERLSNQVPTAALFGLGTFTGYLFPLTPFPFSSNDAVESDESLRQQFMLVGYDVLKRSLSESEEKLSKNGFTGEALRIRKVNLALSAGVLAAMSSRYDFEHFVELNMIAATLLSGLPAQLAPIVTIQVAAVKALIGSVEKTQISDAEIIGAIAREDYTTAERLISEIKDEAKKKSWSEIVLRAQAGSFLKRGEPLNALSTVRKMTNAHYAIPLLIDIAKVGNKKHDESLSLFALQAIQDAAGALNKGMKAKTMFAVSTELAYLMKEQSFLMLQASVADVNELSELKSDQSKKVSYAGEKFWNDPDNFLTSSAMMRAFANQGEIDIQRTLLIAGDFRDNSLQMVARLAAIERLLKKAPQQTEPKLPSKK